MVELVVGDIHGKRNILDDVLSIWEEYGTSETKLIINGDYIDRGTDSQYVIKTLYNLKETHKDSNNLILIWGNHDRMMYDTLFKDSPKYWVSRNGMDKTLESFGVSDGLIKEMEEILTSISYIRERCMYQDRDDNWLFVKGMEENENYYLEDIATYLELKNKVLQEIDGLDYLKGFFTHLEEMYESSNIIVAHAGLDYSLEDYTKTPESFREWAREMFYNKPSIYTKAPSDKLSIFGHTPTKYLGSDEYNPVYLTENIIYIDGGSYVTGTQNMVIYEEGNEIAIIKVGK